MLANGETEAGVSIFFVNDDIDAGALCAQRSFSIEAGETLDEFLSSLEGNCCRAARAAVTDRSRHRRVDALGPEQGSYYSWPKREDVRRFQAAGRHVW